MFTSHCNILRLDENLCEVKVHRMGILTSYIHRCPHENADNSEYIWLQIEDTIVVGGRLLQAALLQINR